MRKLEGARRIVRWIHHRQQNIGGFCERLPALANLECSADRCHEPEDVSRRADALQCETLTSGREKLSEYLGLGAPGLFGENLRRKTLVRFGKADVIELNLAETHLDRFVCNAEVVLPYRVRIR